MYEEKPPRVEAVQWDGTHDGAQDVLDLVQKSDDSVGFRITTIVDHNTSVEEGFTRLTFDRTFGYIRDAGPSEMRERDWLVMTRERQLKILSNDEFEAVYEKVDGD